MIFSIEKYSNKRYIPCSFWRFRILRLFVFCMRQYQKQKRNKKYWSECDVLQLWPFFDVHTSCVSHKEHMTSCISHKAQRHRMKVRVYVFVCERARERWACVRLRSWGIACTREEERDMHPYHTNTHDTKARDTRESARGREGGRERENSKCAPHKKDRRTKKTKVFACRRTHSNTHYTQMLEFSEMTRQRQGVFALQPATARWWYSVVWCIECARRIFTDTTHTISPCDCALDADTPTLTHKLITHTHTHTHTHKFNNSKLVRFFRWECW